MLQCLPSMAARGSRSPPALRAASPEPPRARRLSVELTATFETPEKLWQDTTEVSTEAPASTCGTLTNVRSCASCCSLGTLDGEDDPESLPALLTRSRLRLISDCESSAPGPGGRYGADARLPSFTPGRDVPVLGLLNPRSGAGAGADILAAARRTPYYCSRFFDILEVVKSRERGGLLDLFRQELCSARLEAAALGTRPRLVSAGGDGTASFALFVVFSALRADNFRAEDGLADRGNGFIWTDAELEESFPALAHMPLGSANDFANTLGWGCKYPGDRQSPPVALQQLCEWIKAAIEPAASVASFDLWGIMPEEGQESCNFKLCELGGQRGADPKEVVDGTAQLVMKEAGTPVPFFVCLYFSAGFGAYMTARFQLNRRHSPAENKLEYARQALGIATEAVPPQLQTGLAGVEVACEDGAYFPPRQAEGNSGDRYREVGFLNVNWQAGMAQGSDRASFGDRVNPASSQERQPVKFNDGRLDMYRLKFRSVLKSFGPRYQTDKRKSMKLTYRGSKGKGLFFQWDGEARFAFSPSGEPFSINIQKVMTIPVVLGPRLDAKRVGDPMGSGVGAFRFEGASPELRRQAAGRVLRLVAGQLDRELNATPEEIKAAGFPMHGDKGAGRA